MLDLKESTRPLARWRLTLLKVVFNIVCRPGSHYYAANKMSRLPKKVSKKQKEIADVDRASPADCIDGQINKSATVLIGNEDTVVLTTTTRVLNKVQGNDMLCQNINEILKKDGTIIMNEDGLLCGKALTGGVLQNIDLDLYTRTILYHGHCPTLTGHPETKRMSNDLKNTFLAPHGL